MVKEYRSSSNITYYVPTDAARNDLLNTLNSSPWVHYSDRLVFQLPAQSEYQSLRWKARRSGNYMHINIYHTYASTKAQYETVLRDAERVAREALKIKNEYNRLKYAYDYVLNRTEYATKANGDPAEYTPSGISTQSAYSAYKDRLTVCNGYASYLLAIYQKMGYKYYPRTLTI